MRLARPILTLVLLVAAVTSARGAEITYRPLSAEDLAKQEKTAVATVQGRPLATLRDLNQALGPLHHRTALAIHRRGQQWLRDFLGDLLVGLEASKRKIMPDDLLRAELGSDGGSGFEAARRQYVERLWQAAQVKLLVPEPPPPGVGAELIYNRATLATRSAEMVATAGSQGMVSARDYHQGLSIFYYDTMREVHRQHVEWLRGFVGDRLVAQEAGRRGVSVDGLLRAELGAAAAEPTRREAARREYAERLRKTAAVTVSLAEPDRPQVLATESNTSPVIGLEDAPITIIEMCTFTSPRCREIWRSLREVVKQHGQRVRIAHRDAPEPGNPASLTAAIAGRCAHRQKRYWPYHDLLYDNQDRLGEPGALQVLARQAGLDAPSFDRCLSGRETAREVLWDAMEVRRLGLTELPSLFANSTYIGGVPPLGELTRVLESVALQ